MRMKNYSVLNGKNKYVPGLPNCLGKPHHKIHILCLGFPHEAGSFDLQDHCYLEFQYFLLMYLHPSLKCYCHDQVHENVYFYLMKMAIDRTQLVSFYLISHQIQLHGHQETVFLFQNDLDNHFLLKALLLIPPFLHNVIYFEQRHPFSSGCFGEFCLRYQCLHFYL